MVTKHQRRGQPIISSFSKLCGKRRSFPPISGVCTHSTLASRAHPIYCVEGCIPWKMPRSGTRERTARKPTIKVIENARQRAKTASLIRKRPAGPHRAISQSQPQAQGLDQLAEAASVAEPTNIPPSGQSPASITSASDNQELPPVRTIARCALVRSRSPSSSLTDEPKEYYIEWLIYMGKELLYSDVVSSDK
jgi:hypothetical protein